MSIPLAYQISNNVKHLTISNKESIVNTVEPEGNQLT